MQMKLTFRDKIDLRKMGFIKNKSGHKKLIVRNKFLRRIDFIKTKGIQKKLRVRDKLDLKNRLYKKQKMPKRVSECQNEISQQDYLNMFDITQNGGIEQQCWAKANINKFNKSVQYTISQCIVCQEAWPLKSRPKAPYVCSHCVKDKKSPRKFSLENSMIPSSVPHELQDLTQIEEMLIARALPIMRIYIKPGGQ